MNDKVYVDELFQMKARGPQAFFVGSRNGHFWCHLWTRNLNSLHAMAAKLGLKRAWFQNKPGFPHYDLTPSKRRKAVALGAIECTLKELLRKVKDYVD